MQQTRFRLVDSSATLTLEELSDDDLMTLVCSDAGAARGAYETLIARHQRLVLGLAVRYTGDTEVGHDVAQDVFCKLWSEPSAYHGTDKLRSYLVAMTINRCRHVIRRTKTGTRKLEELTERGGQPQYEENTPLATILSSERAAWVQQQLTKLPAKTRAVIILRFTHEMRLDEISSVLNMPVGTVKSHISRGIKRLYTFCHREA